MKEIRLHGRGGQGSVTAAEMIAVAAFEDKRFSQAFPAFGVERRGAPVMAFARIADKPIRIRSQVYEPDYVIVQDVTLLDVVDVAVADGEVEGRAGVVDGLAAGGAAVADLEAVEHDVGDEAHGDGIGARGHLVVLHGEA